MLGILKQVKAHSLQGEKYQPNEKYNTLEEDDVAVVNAGCVKEVKLEDVLWAGSSGTTSRGKCCHIQIMREKCYTVRGGMDDQGHAGDMVQPQPEFLEGDGPRCHWQGGRTCTATRASLGLPMHPSPLAPAVNEKGKEA